jgi:predicted ATPase/class 3 adenylate cyclase
MSGTLTFLLTDVVGSTRRWEEDAASMSERLAWLDRVVENAVGHFRGTLVKPRGEGDSHFTVFDRASDAADAALEIVRKTTDEQAGLRLRCALHSGEVEARDGDFYGPTVNRCARLRSLANPSQILLSQASAALAREHLREGADLLDLGSHRLKDLLRPERVYQLCHPSLPRDFPTLPSLDRTPHNLPIQITSFIGRDRDVATLSRLMRDHRLVTVTGTGGAGKTRLAQQAAAEAIEKTPGGVWFIDLSSLRTESSFAEAALRAIGRQGDADPVAALASASAGGEMLLLLDNCEHLVEHVAHFALALLRETPNVGILATSREPLRIPGEQLFPLRPLELPRSGADALAVAASEAGRLFEFRAKSRRPDFRVDSSNAADIARICRMLDGLPLAIEQAAGNVDFMSPAEIGRRLEGHLERLATDERGVPERHRTLWSTIEWSYDLLSVNEQALFRRLAVFFGGWTSEGAEAVCSAPPILPDEIPTLLHSLVAKSLVAVDEAPQGERRFRLLESVRQFARLRQDEAEEHQLCARLAEYVLNLAVTGDEQFGGADDAHWMRRLDAELDNFRASLHWAATAEPHLGLRIVFAMRRFLYRRAYFRMGRDWMDTFLGACTDASEAEQARAFNVLGAFEGALDHYAAAVAAYQRSLDLAQKLSDRDLIASVQQNLGLVHAAQGNLEDAAAALGCCLKTYEQGGRREIAAQIKQNMGRLLTEMGRYDEADAFLSEAVEYFRSSGDASWLALSRANQAHCLLRQGQDEAASQALAESFRIWREDHDWSAVSVSLLTVGLLALRCGAAQTAAELLGAASRMRSELESPPSRYEYHVKQEIAAAVDAALSETEADQARIRGEGRAFEEALEIALAFCARTH